MRTITICAAAFALIAPAISHAAVDDSATAVKVSYQDLDLSRSSGATVMLQRLDQASLEACGASQFSVRDYRDAVQRTDCYRDGVQQAVANLNAPAVTRLYNKDASVTVASSEAGSH
jgi:UrcA family protein